MEEIKATLSHSCSDSNQQVLTLPETGPTLRKLQHGVESCNHGSLAADLEGTVSS